MREGENLREAEREKENFKEVGKGEIEIERVKDREGGRDLDIF